MSDLNYDLATEAGGFIPSPEINYQPKTLKTKPPKIGLVGAGGITSHHLNAYRTAGYEVLAICDLDLERAISKRDEFYPEAIATKDISDVLDNPDIGVVDIATHPPERPPLIEAALRSGKHVLSQKPFVIDLDEGERLVALAEENGLLLAVNQNGRWAPHVSAMREIVSQGLIGEVIGVHVGLHWNHGWTVGTPFDEIHHLVLYDFAIHWFDMLHCYVGEKVATKTYASLTRASEQKAKPPLLGQALVEFEGAQATLVFDGYTTVGSLDTTILVGTKGMVRSEGPNLNEQTVTLTTEAGVARLELEGTWFPDGFRGTMAELLSALEEGREPSHSGRNNLRGLATCFAALKSADTGQPQVPGQVRKL
ncbi:MAG: Gfo/Idh/MocA family oxidoreductase [Fimbriimonadaceae bacterium]|jgi:predicted dehydrogenase|nr:Gfo/Idh/MocA family oxidoreductase [Fimbriimonadaceae bacterium]